MPHTHAGPTRKIFIEFLERSCTAEFSGFLLYKELGRRLKSSCPAVAGERDGLERQLACLEDRIEGQDRQ